MGREEEARGVCRGDRVYTVGVERKKEERKMGVGRREERSEDIEEKKKGAGKRMGDAGERRGVRVA